MLKYIEIGKAEWKNSLAFRVDTWLSALFAIFQIALVFLLFKAVFRGADTFDGMTLQQMTSYYLFAGMFSQLTQGDMNTWGFSREIKDGQYSKYVVRPASPLYTFMISGIAGALLPVITNTVILGLMMLVFSGMFVLPTLTNLLWSIAIIAVATLFNSSLNYLIACTSFKFNDISGFYIIKNIAKSFLAGQLLPLNLIFGAGSAFVLFSPFSYLLYYPVSVLLGTANEPPYLVLLILAGWTAFTLILCKITEKKAPAVFEGVGI